MFDWLSWFTDLANSKQFALVWFFVFFVGVIIYVYASKKRSRRLESYKYIPFQDDDETDVERRKEMKNG